MVVVGVMTVMVIMVVVVMVVSFTAEDMELCVRRRNSYSLAGVYEP